MSVFDELVGQRAVREQLQRAAHAARLLAARFDEESAEGAEEGSRGAPADAPISGSDAALSQAWLFTGPPGSGRSIAARALAAALECTGEEPGCGQCHACQTVLAGTHPDVTLLTTEGVTITADQTRAIVAESYTAPGSGRWRIIIIEDADRMLERTTNVLLKAIEEPPERTFWMLCTPSPDDVLPTIRSRCRRVNLVVPAAEDVAELLVRRDGIEPQRALQAARAAQSHIGRARGLATDVQVRQQREETLLGALGIRGTGDAVIVAQRVFDHAKKQADAQAERDNERERQELLATLGVREGARVPPAVRAQVRELEEKQKRRATRTQRDVLDRDMVDLLSLYRDILTVQLGAQVPLINADLTKQIEQAAAAASSEQSVRRMDAIATARQRLAGNVAPQLAIEAMMVALRPQG
ncbi:DNA polymerase III subunit delta' [Actinobaculum sp. 352]|uniref:DNA polymerase III subunit delta' n=1 Tax=Actinobaculum sp. 352 TaxID=2490946 RepID=UPI000F7DFEA6|nr:DNA polymerase III subunit delta' [Actinobaculum sp. 352]RTE49245.1 DNA polymerase III subunit delta' [Actinobaculum sp. 352]